MEQADVVREFSGKTAVERYTREATKGLWNSEEKLIKKYFKKGSKVLDIGCGTGRTTLPLHKMSYKVTGLDITPKFVEIAKRIAKKKGLKINYVLGDATKLNYKDGYFDNALFSFNGWAQIPGEENRLKALKEVFRVLRPGGHFVFTSHVRNLEPKYLLNWIRRWLRFYLLKPLGFNIEEKDFGDIFFTRDSTAKYKVKQFIHIPTFAKVKALVEKAGFELIFNDRRDNIAVEGPDIDSGNCMFYVCKKT